MNFPSISLIIPCYNEAQRIAMLFEGVEQFAKAWKGDFECILVDDGSEDATALFIEEHPVFYALKKDHRARLVRQSNLGKGAALKNGITYAIKDFTLTLDADMASLPIELLNWLALRKQFYEREVLIGSRELKQSVVESSYVRRFVGLVFNAVLTMLTKLNIKDTQCGFKLYATPMAKMLFKDLETAGWAHDVELLLRANAKGLAIVEMPLTWKAVTGSKINLLKDSLKMLWEVIKISGMKMN